MRASAVAAAVINDVGPELAPEGLARITGFAGQGASKGGEPVNNWADAAAYAERVNRIAFPHYGPAQWEAFARRLFVEKDGKPVLDYDPAIAKAFAPPPPPEGQAPPPPPDLWPLFKGLAGRPLLTVRGGVSDLLSPDILGRMQEAIPDMAVAEVPGVGHAPMLDEPEALTAIDALMAKAP